MLALVYTVVRGDKARMAHLGADRDRVGARARAERWVVNENGGVIVAGAAWLGVILGARRAGIAKKSLVLLLYPLLSLVIIIAADQAVLDPWGMSWLWVAAVLGPDHRRAHGAQPEPARPQAEDRASEGPAG